MGNYNSQLNLQTNLAGEAAEISNKHAKAMENLASKSDAEMQMIINNPYHQERNKYKWMTKGHVLQSNAFKLIILKMIEDKIITEEMAIERINDEMEKIYARHQDDPIFKDILFKKFRDSEIYKISEIISEDEIDEDFQVSFAIDTKDYSVNNIKCHYKTTNISSGIWGLEQGIKTHKENILAIYLLIVSTYKLFNLGLLDINIRSRVRHNFENSVVELDDLKNPILEHALSVYEKVNYTEFFYKSSTQYKNYLINNKDILDEIISPFNLKTKINKDFILEILPFIDYYSKILEVLSNEKLEYNQELFTKDILRIYDPIKFINLRYLIDDKSHIFSSRIVQS